MKDYKKLYEDALERARKLYDSSEYVCEMDSYATIFPELKESEDERNKKIKQEVIEMLHYYHSKSPCFIPPQFSLEETLTWLEKQGEQKEIETTPIFRIGDILKRKGKDYIFIVDRIQGGYYHCDHNAGAFFPIEKQDNWELVEQKPTDKIETKFKVGDWITNGDYTWKIVEVKPLDYILQSQDGNIVDDTISYVDEQFHSFTIEDAKEGDVLATTYFIFIFKNIDSDNGVHYYCQYETSPHENDNQFDIALPQSLMGRVGNSNYSPATKEQRDLLFQKMKEAGYEWDADKKELKKIKPFDKYEGLTSFERALADICEGWLGMEIGWKQYIKNSADILLNNYLKKWNKEDEEQLDRAIYMMEQLGMTKSWDDVYNWLKALKDRIIPQQKRK